MAVATQPASTRTVVLLRPAEQKRLKKLAAAEKVSAGEIIRRSLRLYEKPPSAEEAEIAAILLAQLNAALDETLVSISSARAGIRESLDQIGAMQAEAQQQRAARA